MGESTAAKNKAIVLEAFETLFNKRDYAAAERFWSPNYLQHSAHTAPGRKGGLFNLLKQSRSDCRRLPPRQFIKCMSTNKISTSGRGVETYNLHSSWNNFVGKMALLRIAR